VNSDLIFAVSALLALGGITFKLVLDRMDTSEVSAARDIEALRNEIATTKSDAKDAVAAAAVASKDAVAATASALRDAVAAATTAAREGVDATAHSLTEQIKQLDHRVEKLEDSRHEK
jgi:hypothetical protein